MPNIVNNISEFFSESLSNIDFAYFTIVRISFFDILDILIVAYLLYRIILWIKETRAWALFKGVVVILVISAIAFMFGLTTIVWLMRTALSVGVLAMIILFQPELRKALEQLGKGRLSLPFGLVEDSDSSISSKTVDEVITASFAMAHLKTGGLILIENVVMLGELEDTGIRLDACVSSALLLNIFEDKTPLHDGAVIIRNNRIAAASCILPLTANEIGKELGTRHRAAVGASEVSDCYAIVISEETGGVSLALGGKLYRNQTAEDLRKMILKESSLSKKRFVLKRGGK
ncbi:MAG: diadenylate cyclase CdaA [Defluviitaleaceae bacterium]|nr:diadenylate cyclase CdaA [Defluviitaleaceae bacterium]